MPFSGSKLKASRSDSQNGNYSHSKECSFFNSSQRQAGGIIFEVAEAYEAVARGVCRCPPGVYMAGLSADRREASRKVMQQSVLDYGADAQGESVGGSRRGLEDEQATLPRSQGRVE